MVAQAVRELTQRSATAAKEIKSLIVTSGEQVRTGVALVGDTGKSLEVMVAEVQEINTAVNTIDQGTQQNAAMVEESTAASHSPASEADALNKLIAQFNLGRAPAHQPAVRLTSSNPRPVASPAKVLGRRVANAFGAMSE